MGYLSHKEKCGKSIEEQTKYLCDICGKEYTTVPGLKYHMNIHIATEVWYSMYMLKQYMYTIMSFVLNNGW